MKGLLASYRKLLDAVRRSYPPEKRDEERRSDFLAWLVFRPVSFLVTPAFLLAGFNADGVTALGFLIAFAMPAAAWTMGPAAYGVVAALVALNQVLDCVDGNVARTTRASSRVGPMLDGQCTVLFWSGWFIAVGALAHAPGACPSRELGLLLAVLLLAQRSLEDALDACVQERVRWEPPLPPGVGGSFSLASLGRPIEQTVAIGGLFLAGRHGVLPWFAGMVAAYQLGLLALWMPRYCRTLWRHSTAGGRSP